MAQMTLVLSNMLMSVSRICNVEHLERHSCAAGGGGITKRVERGRSVKKGCGEGF